MKNNEATGRYLLAMAVVLMAAIALVFLGNSLSVDASSDPSIDSIEYDTGTLPTNIVVTASNIDGFKKVQVFKGEYQVVPDRYISSGTGYITLKDPLSKGSYSMKVKDGSSTLVSKDFKLYKVNLDYSKLISPISDETMVLSEDSAAKYVLSDYYVWFDNPSKTGSPIESLTEIEYVNNECRVYAFDRTEVTITADNASKLYGDEDPVFTATVLPKVAYEFDINYTRAPGTDVGKYAITPTGDTTQGIYRITFAPGELTINPRPVDDPVVVIQKVTYDGDEHTTDISVGLGAPYTVTQATGTVAGTYKATFILNDKGNYIWESTKSSSDLLVAALTIDKADPVYTAPVPKIGLIYTGEAQELIGAGTGTTPGEFMYSLEKEGEYAKSIPAGTDAGSYKVWYLFTPIDTDNYNTVSGSVDAAIAKASNTWTEDLSIEGWTYGNEPSEPSAEAKFGTPAYTYSDAEEGTYVPAVPKDAGTWYVKAEVIGTDNYTGIIAKKSFVIAKADNSWTEELTIEGWTYGQDPNEPSAEAKFGTPIFTYSDAEEGTYVPTVSKDAGTWYVKAEVIGTDNYTGITAKKSFVIAKADPTYTAPAGKIGLTYTGKTQALIDAGTSTTPGKFTYSLEEEGTYGANIPTGTNAGEYTVWYVFTPDDTDNYNTASGSVAVIISKAVIDSVTVDPTSIKFDKKDHYPADDKVVAKSGDLEDTNKTFKVYTELIDGEFSGEVDEAITAGTYYVVITPSSNFGLQPVTAEGKTYAVFVITPASPAEWITEPEKATGLVFNGKAQDLLINNGSTDDGTVMYSINSGDYSETVPKATDADTYVVSCYIAGDGTHTDSEPIVFDVTISKLSIADAEITLGDTLTYNGSEQTQTVSSVFVDEIEVKPSSYVLSGNTGTDADDYTLTITAADESNFTGYATKAWTISKAIVDLVSVDPASAKYDGDDHIPVASNVVVMAGEVVDTLKTITVYATFDGETFSDPVDEAIIVGTYYVVVTPSDNFELQAEIEEDKTYAEFSITTDSVAEWTTEPTAATKLVFNEGEQCLLGQEGVAKNGTAMYKIGEFGAYSAKLPTAKDADEYTVYFYVKGDIGYADSAEGHFLVSIAKADSYWDTVPAAKTGLVYDGKAQDLITSGTAVGGTAMYRLDDGAYGTVVPFATEADEYTVYYKIEETKNYKGVDEASFKVTISKADPVYAAPAAKDNLTYTGEAQALIIAGTSTTPGTFTYSLEEEGTYAETLPTGTDAGTYTVWYVFTPDDADNYNTASGNVAAFIDKAESAWSPAPVAKTGLAYDGTELELITSGTAIGGTATYKLDDGVYGTAVPSAVNAKEYTVYFKVEETKNYKGVAEESFKVSISKANPIYTAPAVKIGMIYTGEAQALVFAGTSTTPGTFTYSLEEKGTYSADIPTGMNAGTYMVWYIFTPSDADNYNAASGSVPGAIAKADPVYTVPAVKTDLVYTGEAQALVFAGTSTTPGTFTYSLEEKGTYSADIPTGMNAGTYMVWYVFSPSDADNYNTASGSVSALIAKADSSWDPAPVAKTDLIYNGTAQELIASGTAVGGTAMYKLDDGAYGTSVPSAIDADVYTVYYKIEETKNYKGVSEASFSVEISKVSVDKPTAEKDLVYNASEQIGVKSGTGYVLSSDFKAINAGDYTAVAKLEAGHVWSDGTSEDLEIGWSIARKSVTVTADDKEKDFGTSDPTFTAKVEGVIDDFAIVCTVTRDVGEAVGTYAITPAGDAEQGNYTVTYKNGTLTIVYAERTVVDDKGRSSVDGQIAPGSVLTVTERYEPSDWEGIDLSGKDIRGKYDIKLENATMKPFTGELEVTIDVGSDLNGSEVTVYHHGTNGIEQFVRTVQDGKVTVTVSDLSPFIATHANTVDPGTGIATGVIIAIVVIVLIVGIAAVILYKKKTV